MSKYWVVFHTRGPVNLKNEQHIFKMVEGDEETNITVADLFMDFAGTRVQCGLSLKVELEAESVKSALRRGQYWVDLLLSLICISNRTFVDIPQVQLCFGAEPGMDTRKFTQYVHFPDLLPGDTTAMDMTRLTELFGRLASKDSNTLERVIRAVNWYRLSIQENEDVESFLRTWIGLEAMNPLLE